MAEMKFKILIAEDNQIIRDNIAEAFLKRGFEVLTSPNGKMAVHTALNYHPDIIIMDYHMPILNGFEAVAKIRQYPSCTNIPIIILTSDEEKDTKMEGLSLDIDEFLTKPTDEEEIVARVQLLIKRSMQKIDSNPLTKLPGNPSIQARIEKAINAKENFAVMYMDLNNFKVYNDVYGFKEGDNVIKQTAKLIETISLNYDGTSFLGHIGGDDFICVCKADVATEIAKQIIREFDLMAPTFYNDADREKGFLSAKDRSGDIKDFALLSIAIAVVHNTNRVLSSYGQISAIASELKHYAKSQNGSFAAIDRRGDN
ncbi:MAG: response regulator [Elusimicrobiaceae bacterium]|nr:response regulator [Elusimicrobiaceae bacterium]